MRVTQHPISPLAAGSEGRAETRGSGQQGGSPEGGRLPFSPLPPSALPGISPARGEIGCIALALLLALPAHAADWSAKTGEKPYAIQGTTGLALYRSIGENGPKTSAGTRAIALTRFDLKWRRDYRPEGSACVLAFAKPFLTITTELPKPSAPMPPALATRWTPFIDGIRAHEAVHGQMIRELTAAIISETVGTRQENDPGCTKIRPVILEKVKSAYARHQEKSRAFDKAELGKGGNVEGLVRGLVE